jgi:Carboxypeptidase regulatory-like domain/TonB dependent receptor
MRFSLLIPLALAVSLATPAAAQEQSGSIQGIVKDAQGAVLPGATVEAKSAGNTGSNTVVSDAQGVYRFPALPPGDYEITASMSGFTSSKVTNVRLSLGLILKIDMTLALAGIVESVQVSAESPLIDVKQNANSTSISAAAIDRIPKGRDFTSVITMAPGSNDESRAGGISIDGASGSENRFIVDGVDTTHLTNGTTGKTVVTDFIGEVQVKTSGYNAEFPGATGGVVSAVTKSGTNAFRGSASFYYTDNDALKGELRPTLRLRPTNTTQAEYIKTPLDKIPNSQPVFEVGGPIRQNQLWFYAGYAPVRTTTTRTVRFTQPAANGQQVQTFEVENPTDRVTSKVTANLNNSMRLAFSYAPTWARSRGSLPGNFEPDGTSTSNPNTDYASTGSNDWNNAYAGNFDWTVTRSWFMSFRGGYFYYDRETLGNGTSIVHSFANENSMFPEIPSNLRQQSGYTDNKSSAKTVRDLQGRYLLDGTSTHYLHAKGEHTLKYGFRFERIINDVYNGQIEPTITLNWNASYTDSNGVVSRGQYGYYTVSKGVVRTGDIHSDNWGFFIQDSWSPFSRLTINAGVRAESEKVPFYSPGSSGNAIDFGFGDKIAPRAGFAYDVKGDGRWKAYGSFGRYFDITKLEMPRGSLGGEQWLRYNWTLDTFDWPNINCQEGTTGCPGRYIETERLRFGSHEIDPETAAVMTKYFGAPRNLLQDDMKPVQSQEAIIGLEHEFNNRMSGSVRYVHKWVTRTIEDFGWNEGGTEYYFIGNPGEDYIGRQEFLWGPGKLYQTGTPAFMPKPVRDYDAVEFVFRKRLSNNWSAQALYEWSRLYGNFPGLASSDEGGRNSPNVNRMYDSIWMMYDDSGSRQPVLGRLNTDRPHLFKLQATYDFPWGTGVGLNFYARSGALFSKQLSYQGYSPTFYQGRGTLDRTPVEQAVALLVQHDIRLGGNRRLNLSLNVENLFDSDVATAIFANPYRDRLTLSPIESFFNGFDTEAIAAANPAVYRPDARYRMDSSFLGRRDIRLGASFRF